MPISRPTLSEIVDRIKSDLSTRIIGSATPLRRSLIVAFATAYGFAVHALYGYLIFVSRQIFADTAEDEFLVRIAQIFGVEKNSATFAEGDVLITGVDGSFVDAGTILQSAEGIEYTTDVGGSISSGTLTLSVTCTQTGTDGNLEQGETLQFLTPIVGVDNEVTVEMDGIAGGAAEEDIESLRARLIDVIQAPPHGGNENDYVQWAKEVNGVTRVWVYPSQFGSGTVGVAFVRDNDSGTIIPDPTEVAEVQDYIDEKRPVTADVTVYAPSASPLDFTIKLTPDSSEIRDAVEAELQDLLVREAEPGGTLLLSHIREAISSAAGEVDHILTVPSGDVVESAGNITTLGNITWV